MGTCLGAILGLGIRSAEIMTLTQQRNLSEAVTD